MKLKYKSVTIITLLLIAFNVAAITPFHVMAADEDGNIHGTVVDSDGNPIYRVKVTAYDSKGGLAAKDYTDNKGYFRMTLGGTYTLVFEKTGYVTQRKTVQVELAPTDDPNLDDVKMGNIVMENTISLTSSVVKRITSPGNTLQLQFTVTNNGETDEYVNFSVSSPQGWQTRILDSVSEIESILLATGSQTLSIEIKVPESATSTGTVTLTAAGTSVDTLAFEITPMRGTDEIQLVSTYLSISKELGKTIELPLTISNKGEVDKTVNLVAEAPNGWTVSFKTSANMAVKSLYMKTGDSLSLNMVLEPSDNAEIGDYDVVVEATDQNGVLDTLEISISLEESQSELEVISTFSEVTVEAGDNIMFPLVIWNKGDADTVTLLTVPVLPENWDASFIADDLEIASIHIGADESESIQLIVDPPSSVSTGTYSMVVKIESDDGSQHELEYTIEVTGSYQLALSLSTLYTSGQIGDTVSYTARVTNGGETAVTSVYVEATVPDDWEATVTPKRVDILEPKDTTTFTVVVSIPSDTEAGDYLVTMQAFSDQLESEDSDVRITAQASNTWGYIGIGIALVAVAGAVLLFKRFKRR